MKLSTITAITLLAAAMSPSMATADVKLPCFVTDSMVVQQNSRFRITGGASGNVTIKPSWTTASINAPVSRQGVFTAELETPPAGGPFTIVFTDSDGSKTLRGIWSGEVWLCSGQSNMEMPVGGWGKVMNYTGEIANATHPRIHFLQIAKQTAFTPQTDAQVNMGGWRTCTPQTVENFSSIAYFFARDLTEKLDGKTHIGVIDCTWGGTPAEAWTSVEGVAKIPGFEEEIAMLRDTGGDIDKMMAAYAAKVEDWSEMTEATATGFDPAVYADSARTIYVPSMIEDHLGSFDGIFWLQRRVEIPEELAGRQLSLDLGMIDDEDITYFNGTEIGRGAGYDTPRHYTVPDSLVKAGTALISVRVSDFEGGGGIWGKPENVRISHGDTEIRLAGDWALTLMADFSKLPRRPVSVNGSSFPSVLYNAMFAPLKDMPVKGVLWYQGCANVGRHEQYAPLFRQLITDWRTLRDQPDMPFYFMQLAGYMKPRQIQPESDWAALRAAQAEALALPNTAMATAIDIGNPDDIHPKNKQEAARRFALIALRNAYGRSDIIASAPVLLQYECDGSTVELTFDGPVSTGGGSPAGFIVCLPDGTWVTPGTSLSGDRKILLSAPDNITEVRYDWADFPDGNLRGQTGLPVTPFASIIEQPR